MRRSVLALLVIGVFLIPANADWSEPKADAPLDGFSAQHARTEREWESKFRALPDPQRQRQYMQLLSARPHHVGSAYDKQNAEWILSKFKEWGLDAKIETFKVLFPHAQTALGRTVRADALRGQIAGTGVCGGSYLQPARRAAPHIQRVLPRWRCNGSAGVRQLRRARRL